MTKANAEIELAKIWAIDPGIPVWISPLNFYEGEECEVTNGNQIPNEGSVIANTLVVTLRAGQAGAPTSVLSPPTSSGVTYVTPTATGSPSSGP